MNEYLSSRWLGNITTTICREGFTCSLMALMYVSVRSLGSSSTMGSLTCNREYNDWDTYLHQLHHDNYSTCTNLHSHTNYIVSSYTILPCLITLQLHILTQFLQCNTIPYPLLPSQPSYIPIPHNTIIAFLGLLTPGN